MTLECVKSTQDVDIWMKIPIQDDFTFELIIPFRVIKTLFQYYETC